MKNSSNIFSQATEQINQIIELQKVEEVKKSISPGVRYITIVTAAKISNPKKLRFLWGWTNPFTRITSYKAIDGEPFIGYLMHDGSNLSCISQAKQMFSIPLSEIIKVDTASDIGFVVSTQSEHYLFGQILGVNKDSSTSYRTFDKPSDVSRGWYQEFADLNVISKAQVAKDTRTTKIYWVVFGLSWAVVIVWYLSL